MVKRGPKPVSSELKRERYLASHTKYNNLNREKRNDYANEKIQCGCGSIISKGNKTAHLKTNKHRMYLNTMTN
jgi:hypothetical protein